MMEIMMSNKEVTQDKFFERFLSNILNRLVEFLKNTKKDIDDIIICLNKNEKNEKK